VLCVQHDRVDEKFHDHTIATLAASGRPYSENVSKKVASWRVPNSGKRHGMMAQIGVNHRGRTLIRKRSGSWWRPPHGCQKEQS
jgi:hypothetical protein